MTRKPVTVSITTRNRPEALTRCLRSLSCAAPLVAQVIVADDASEPPVRAETIADLSRTTGLPIDLMRLDEHGGTAGAKNLIAERARTPFLLSLDDDAFLVDGRAIERGVDVLEKDGDVAAIAFAQADEHGRRRHVSQQPSTAERPAYVPAFIGFGCLIRREHLMAVGGYRALFRIHGEEREICLRWLDRGWRVVYLPDAPIAHVADPANRDPTVAYVRHIIRNDCLNALFNEPAARALISIPMRLRNFRRMAARLPGGDPQGIRWILTELWSRWPEVRRSRRPLRWRTFGEWKRLRSGAAVYPES